MRPFILVLYVVILPSSTCEGAARCFQESRGDFIMQQDRGNTACMMCRAIALFVRAVFFMSIIGASESKKQTDRRHSSKGPMRGLSCPRFR